MKRNVWTRTGKEEKGTAGKEIQLKIGSMRKIEIIEWEKKKKKKARGNDVMIQRKFDKRQSCK